VVAYSFKGRFADAVQSGEKRQTIRANGKRRHAQPGDKLQLYTGMRTKACRKLRDAVCHDVCPITIYPDKVFTFKPQEIHLREQLENLARSDGFSSWAEMRDWFDETHGLPFTGTMIRWLVPLADRQQSKSENP